jgi:choline-sulfatase
MVTRREFLSGAAKGAAGAMAASCFPNMVFGQDGKRPNVLFISIDDLNDWIGCLGGHPNAVTPNIDRLAARGVVFSNAHCNSPYCNPSRSSMLTGLRPSTTGVYDNNQPFRKAVPDAVTLMQHFMANDYYVLGRGKITHGRYPDPPSWHEYVEQGPDPKHPNAPQNGIKVKGIRSQFDWGALDVSDEEMDDYKVATWTAKALQRKHEKPFFLACGLYKPHMPFQVPRKYFSDFPEDEIFLPPIHEKDFDDIPQAGADYRVPIYHKTVMQTNNRRKAVAGYLASVKFVDAQVGRVLDALDNSAYANNTVIVLWGDHGWHLGEKLHWRKGALWEEATRTPIMFAGPGVASGHCERPVSLIDIYPTLINLCDLSEREGLEGANIKSLLKQPSLQWDRPVVTTYLRGNHSIRSERWRYIRYHDGAEEFYDHLHDKMEWTNLAGQAQFKDVIAAHAAWLPKIDAPVGPG